MAQIIRFASQILSIAPVTTSMQASVETLGTFDTSRQRRPRRERGNQLPHTCEVVRLELSYLVHEAKPLTPETKAEAISK